MAFEVKVTKNIGKKTQLILDQYSAAMAREIKAITFEVARSAKQNLTDTSKVDRGFLRSSIDTDFSSNLAGMTGITFAGALHAPAVEFGRKGSKQSPTNAGPNSADAAFPPVDVIRAWVKRNNGKLAVSGRTKTGKTRKANDSDLDTAAYLIARKIYERGIEPSPYLIPAFLEVKPFYKARLVKVLQQVKLKL